MARFYIYVYYQQGNVGSHDIKPITEQPKEGFESELDAEVHLLKLIDARKGFYFDRAGNKFVILKTFMSKDALCLHSDKTIIYRGREWKQTAKVGDCLFCDYCTGCSSWGCTSSACEITGECFGHQMNGTWCPFQEVIPEDHKWQFGENK